MDKAKFVGGMVKTVFILCYVAFMVASIRHVATFFNDFEPNNDNMIGSYALAGAFDVTALVTTIGVMFFRKSMPTWVFVIIWLFIAGIAIYSYIINLEYTSHYQDMTLLMQPTGQTTPVYDAQGVLHYVPVMRVDTSLMWLNPFLASGFTIFSLVYSVIAEFFGTKPPTAEELQARKKYLEDTSSIKEEIAKLEKQNKTAHPLNSGMQVVDGIVKGRKARAETLRNERMNATVDYLRDARELLDKEQEKRALTALSTFLKISEKEALPLLIAARSRMRKEEEEAAANQTQDEDAISINEDVIDEEDDTQDEDMQESTATSDATQETGQVPIDLDVMRVVTHYPEVASWLNTGVLTVSIDTIIKATGKRRTTIEEAIESRQLIRSKNPAKIRVSSVVNWLKTTPIRHKSNATKERITGELESVSSGD